MGWRWTPRRTGRFRVIQQSSNQIRGGASAPLSFRFKTRNEGANIKTITLTDGSKALVDDDCYEYLSQYTWYKDINGYAVRVETVARKQTRYLMHREITKAPSKKQVDHINHNRLDNRLENLRLVTFSENQRNRSLNKNNTSGQNGIIFDSSKSKWRVRLQVDGKYKHFGYFEDLCEAVKARDKAYNENGYHVKHGKTDL